MVTTSKRRFRLGMLVATPGALEVLDDAGVLPLSLVHRHVAGDWGDVGEEDQRANEEALRNGARLLSSYRVGGRKLWIITEADRSSTCVLLPEEY